MYIKSIHNIVADAISRLDYGPVKITFALCWCYHNSNEEHEASTANIMESMNLVFANCNKDHSIYPFITREIAEVQQEDENVKINAEKKGYSNQLVKNTKVLCKNGKMVIPKSLQHHVVAWFCHYLQHPGTKCLKKTLYLLMYWKGLQMTVQSHVKKCHSCQVNKHRKLKYGNLPAKLAITTPYWEASHVDLCLKPFCS